MHTKRVIPCLDVKDGRVVKGVNFVNFRDAGDPSEVASAYDAAGADEVVFLDITASADSRATQLEWVRKVASKVFIPFTVGGGIRTVDDFKAILREGADKISVNSAAIMNPHLVCTFALTPRYQASVNMIVNTRQDSTTTVSTDNITSAKNMIDTYAVIIKSNLVLNDVIQRMGLDMTYSQLADSITVGSVNSTQIMAITVTNENPGLAGKIAQTIAEVAPDVIVEKVEAGSCKAVSDVEIDTTPVYPQTKKTTLLCALAGMVAACALLVVNHLLHNYIVDDEDVQKKLDLPVLGFIPEV